MNEPNREPLAPEDEPGCGNHDHAASARVRPAASDAALDRAARIFRAAGEVSRLRLMDELLSGERCVTDLAEAVGAGISTVSQQLRVLRGEDLVATRREGKHIYYFLADTHVVELLRNVLDHAGEH